MIHHVTMPIRALETAKCIAFYEALGFALVEPPKPLRVRSVWLERSGTQIHLQTTAGLAVPRDSASNDGRPREADRHVAIVVGDYELAVAALSKLGHVVDDRTPYWGSPRGFVFDPSGNKIEIMAYPPSRQT